MVSEGKLSQSEATEIGNRTDVLSYALLAEINTFHNGRVRDIRDAHKHFLQEQISHYQKVLCVIMTIIARMLLYHINLEFYKPEPI